jgi:hypothetical protein
MIMMMMKNKKAQGKIGKTLTWFTGFIIISFVLVLLVTGSSILAGERGVEGVRDKINLHKYEFDELRSQRFLISFLNKDVEFKKEIMSVRDLIIESYSEEDIYNVVDMREIIENEVEGFFLKENYCYVFYVAPEEDSNLGSVKGNPMKFSNRRTESIQVKLLKKGIKLPLIDEQGIEIKFYYGGCN